MELNPENSELKIGELAPYFSLPATDGKIYSISDFANSKALAIIFTSNHCPFAKDYEQRLCELVTEFSNLNVALLAICSNNGVLFPEDSFEQMKIKSEKYNFAYPYLQDNDQSVARAYGASVNPEAFLFDEKKQLCYHGAIDDNSEDANAVKNHYLSDSIWSILEGKKPDPQTTIVKGCSIKFGS